MKKKYIFRWVLVGLLALLVALSVWAWAHRLIAPHHWLKDVWGLLCDPEELQKAVRRLGPWAPLALIALNTAQVVIAPLPGQVFSMLGGVLFGTAPGGTYSLFGSTLGTAAVFWLARRFGRPFVVRLVAARHMEKLDDLVARRGRMFFFIAFLIPFGPHDLICYAIGLTALPLWQMLVLITIARIPGSYFGAWVGSKTGNLAKAIHEAQRVSPTHVWLMVAGAAVIVAIWIVYLRFGDRIEQALLNLVKRITRR
jgi:uncharacterized membrane protein YdjX (TVP38/TMEM64 family)